MKVYISADIEGIATSARWSDCDPSSTPDYAANRRQMSLEVTAACEGAIAAGADSIVVKDAHDFAGNILPEMLPRGVELIRGWSGHPYNMVEGIDSSYDACMFVGYHAPAADAGNPLSHTWSSRTIHSITLNGVPASEFMLFSYCAANEGVPTVYLSGDASVCKSGSELYPHLVTTAVKSGWGGSIRAMHPADACDAIRAGTEKAVKRATKGAIAALPSDFSVEIDYMNHAMAEKASYYSKVERLSTTRVAYRAKEYFEIMRFLRFTI